MNDSLKLDMFFPDELLSITSVDHDDSSIHIKMRSKTHSSKCPECGQETKTYHGTYLRKVQDLPILGKTALENVRNVLFQTLLLDDVMIENGKIYARCCTVYLLST